MELVFVIEISPYNFAKKDYESPQENDPELWNAFWLKSIADSGLKNFKAVKQGSYWVDVTTISEQELEIILKQKLENIEWDFFEEQLSPFSGGIILKEKDSFLLEPTCCSDIGNLKNWNEILTAPALEWQQLWVGHPWVYFYKNNDTISFSDYTESSLDEVNFTINPQFSIPESALQMQLLSIFKQAEELELRILKALFKMKVSQPERVAKLITGNH